jgi:hypothetical protein
MMVRSANAAVTYAPDDCGSRVDQSQPVHASRQAYRSLIDADDQRLMTVPMSSRNSRDPDLAGHHTATTRTQLGPLMKKYS